MSGGGSVARSKLLGPSLKMDGKTQTVAEWLAESLPGADCHREWTARVCAQAKRHLASCHEYEPQLPANCFFPAESLVVSAVPVTVAQLRTLVELLDVALIVTLITSPLTRKDRLHSAAVTMFEWTDPDPELAGWLASATQTLVKPGADVQSTATAATAAAATTVNVHADAKADLKAATKAAKLKLLHLPVCDGDSPTSQQAELLLTEARRVVVEQRRRVLVHCWKGSRRSWTVASLIMGRVLGLSQADVEKTRLGPEARMNPWQRAYVWANEACPRNPDELPMLAALLHSLRIAIDREPRFLTNTRETTSTATDRNECDDDEDTKEDAKAAVRKKQWAAECDAIMLHACGGDSELLARVIALHDRYMAQELSGERLITDNPDRILGFER